MSVRPRLAVLAVLAAGGVAFGGYYLWPSGRHVAPCVPQHARVPAAAQKALAAYTARIRHDVQRSSAGTRTEETWYDSLTGAQRQVWFDSRGRIENEVGTIRQGDKVSTVWVSYAGRTWLSNRDQSARIADSNAAATIAQSYRDRVAEGKAKVVGRHIVHGHEALEVHETLEAPGPARPKTAPVSQAFPTVQIDTWVDRLTYVPLRSRTTVRGHSFEVNSTWVPRTAANVAKTKLVIPPGFKQAVASMHGVDRVLVSNVSRCVQS